VNACWQVSLGKPAAAETAATAAARQGSHEVPADMEPGKQRQVIGTCTAYGYQQEGAAGTTGVVNSEQTKIDCAGHNRAEHSSRDTSATQTLSRLHTTSKLPLLLLIA
jgi:hypothetical protein